MKKLLTKFMRGKQTSSSNSSSNTGDSFMSSAKPTTVTIRYRNEKDEKFECVYAKPGAGALIVANKLSGYTDRWQFRYIPFSNPEIVDIVVESESKEGKGHYHSRNRDEDI